MEFTDVIRKRRMCRGFEDRDVDSETIEAILDVASRFPSAGHTQPQEFIVVREQSLKKSLGEAALGQMFLAEAPVVIAVVSDTRRSAKRYGQRGIDFYSIVDGAFAAMLVLLASINEGLGAAFVAAMDDEEVGKVLGLPAMVRPIGLIAIGHCAEEPSAYPRRPRREIVHADRWQSA